MMRVALATLALLAACCSASVCMARTESINAAASAGAVAHPARTEPPRRAWNTDVSPAPGDLALVQLSFHRRHAESLLERSLRVTVSGAFGGDYLALATPREGTASTAQALILVIDRPSPLLDPLTVHLRVSARRSLGAVLVHQVTDPLTRFPGRAPGHPSRALCDLPAHGALIGFGLRSLSSRGAPLRGFDAAQAVAQAYDAACGLPVESAFTRAVAPSSGGCATGADSSGAICCPPTAICAVPPSPPPAPTPSPPPSPTPSPTPEPPGCAPCDQPPGYACPLAAAPRVCAAPLPRSARRGSVGAH